MKNASKLVLPEKEYINGFDLYGANKVAAQYCKAKLAPIFKGEWQHGWIPPERNFHPESVIGGTGRSRDYKLKRDFFVARKDQVNYLLSQGYPNVHAIGLPIIYVPRPSVTRIPQSLLVMPAHSLPESKEDFNSDEYAQYIFSIVDNFSKIYLCVHKYCYDKGNWIDSFNNKKINVIVGADYFDQNSLLRLAMLFSQFEYVTTNTFGSQVAYASFFDCKVSVAGPRIAKKKSDLEKMTIYKNAPELLDLFEEFTKERVLEKAYPQFVCDPWSATKNYEWAAFQLGLENKRTPSQIKDMFGWTTLSRLKKYKTKYREKLRGFIRNNFPFSTSSQA